MPKQEEPQEEKPKKCSAQKGGGGETLHICGRDAHSTGQHLCACSHQW